MSEENKNVYALGCDIVRDLLPLYCDDSVSGSSCDAIEKHLSECESCKSEYETMCVTLNDSNKTAETPGAAKTLKKVKLKGLLKGIIISIFAVAALIGAGYVLTQEPLIPIPEDEYKISGVYCFDNKIAVNVDINCRCAMSGHIETDKNGEVLNIIYKRPVFNINGRDNWDVCRNEIIFIDRTNDIYINAIKVNFNDKKIWTEGESGDTPVPGYIPIEAEFECSDDSSIVEMSTSDKEISFRYNDGTVKVWDLDGNLIRSYKIYDHYLQS